MAEFDAGETVDTPDGLGVVSGVFTREIQWPVSEDADEDIPVEGSEENPVYIVALLQGGSRPYREDELTPDEFDSAPEPDVQDVADDMTPAENSEHDDKDDIVPGDGREGSDKNEPGSADSTPEDIDFSDSVEQALENKVEEHNEEYGDDEGKRVTMDMLKAVYRRGAGAYSDSHREGITRNQWAMARVNAFLTLVEDGEPENPQYVQDNDLLPEGHPRYSEDETEAEALFSDMTELSYPEWYDRIDEPESLESFHETAESVVRVSNVSTLSRHRGTSDMSYTELIDVPNVDKPGVGFDSWPDSWREADEPARLIALRAWANMGGSWRGCFREMTTEMTPMRARRFCSSFKDTIYGTEQWRQFSD